MDLQGKDVNIQNSSPKQVLRRFEAVCPDAFCAPGSHLRRSPPFASSKNPVRFLVDFSGTEEILQVHALQDAIKSSQDRPGAFEIPMWDEARLKMVKAALLQLGTTISDTRRMC